VTRDDVLSGIARLRRQGDAERRLLKRALPRVFEVASCAQTAVGFAHIFTIQQQQQHTVSR
jgi:hypothetical protein